MLLLVLSFMKISFLYSKIVVLKNCVRKFLFISSYNTSYSKTNQLSNYSSFRGLIATILKKRLKSRVLALCFVSFPQPRKLFLATKFLLKNHASRQKIIFHCAIYSLVMGDFVKPQRVVTHHTTIIRRLPLYLPNNCYLSF